MVTGEKTRNFIQGRHTEGRRHLQRAGRRDRERQVEIGEGAGMGPRA
jgi:hypothetical protein